MNEHMLDALQKEKERYLLQQDYIQAIFERTQKELMQGKRPAETIMADGYEELYSLLVT